MARINVASGTIFQNKLFKNMNVVSSKYVTEIHYYYRYLPFTYIYILVLIFAQWKKGVVFGSPSDFVFLFIILWVNVVLIRF